MTVTTIRAFLIITVSLLVLTAPVAQQRPAEELVGRLLLLAFTGDSAPLARLAEFNPAGFLYYPSNLSSTEAIRTSTHTLQAAAGYPLLFGIDQEGGPFNAYQVDNATLFPGAMALAATGNTDLARAVGEATGQELAYVGLNLNFAPVVDVNSNPDNPIIGIRSFGADASTVAQFGVAYLEGLAAAGVAGVAKHFPGHGDTATDSHLGLASVSTDRARLEAVELVPFKAMIAAGVPGIMSAHVTFPALEPDLPATLSAAVLDGLLRTELGFDGLVITDFMDMRAIADYYGAGEAAVQSVIAGADLVLLGPDISKQRLVYNALHEAVTSGRLSAKRVQAAVAASTAVAQRYPSSKDVAIPDYAAHQTLADEVATKAVTLLRNEAVLPLAAEQHVLVLAPQPRQFGPFPHPGTLLTRYHSNTTSLTISENPSTEEITEIIKQVKQVDVVVLGSYHWQGAFPVGLSELESQLVASNVPVIVVALGNPDDLRFFPRLPAAYLAVYGFREANLVGAAKVLTGITEPQGKLPVPVSNSYPQQSGMLGF